MKHIACRAVPPGLGPEELDRALKYVQFMAALKHRVGSGQGSRITGTFRIYTTARKGLFDPFTEASRFGKARIDNVVIVREVFTQVRRNAAEVFWRERFMP